MKRRHFKLQKPVAVLMSLVLALGYGGLLNATGAVAKTDAGAAVQAADAEAVVDEGTLASNAVSGDDASSVDGTASHETDIAAGQPVADVENASSDIDSKDAGSEGGTSDGVQGIVEPVEEPAVTVLSALRVVEGAAEQVKRLYSFEDGDVEVVAQLEDPAAIPDDAKLVVTQIAPKAQGYNYDAYLAALNEEAGKAVYTSGNTLLYDVAFMVVRDGKAVEVEPAKDAVKVAFTFKDDQLTEKLRAKRASDIEVVHLPLTAKVRKATDSTKEATDISAKDVNVESFEDARVKLGTVESAVFSTESFSGVAFSVPGDEDAAEQGKYKVTVNYVDKDNNPVIAQDNGNYYVMVQQGGSYNWEKIGVADATSQHMEFTEMFARSAGKNGGSPLTSTDGMAVSVVRSGVDWDNGELHDYDTFDNMQLDTYQTGDAVGNYTIKSIDTSAAGKATITLQEKPKYEVTVKVFDYDKVTPLAKNDISERTFVRVKATKDGQEYYAVKPIDLNGKEAATIEIAGFAKTTTGCYQNNDTVTPDEVVYDAGFSVGKNDVRLIAWDGLDWDNRIQDYDSAMAANDTIDGLVFMSNRQVGTTSTLSLRHLSTKYDVRLYFDPQGTDISASEHYYLFGKVEHQSGIWTYFLEPIAITASELAEDSIGKYREYNIPYWKNGDGTPLDGEGGRKKDSFTGNEASIEVQLLKANGEINMNNAVQGTNCATIAEGSFFKDYAVSYGERVKTESAADKSIHHYDPIYLVEQAASSDYDFKSILGPGLDYGITADRLRQKGSDFQSNFATNYYQDGAHGVNPDLSGKSSGTIAIGNYVQYSDSNDGSFLLNPDPDGTVDVNRGNGAEQTIVVYTDSAGRIKDPAKGVFKVVPTTPEQVAQHIVEPIIHHMQTVSAEMAAHAPTVTPLKTSDKVEIDTLGYPDDATVYVDADAIQSAYGPFTAGGTQLSISKKQDQTIVFNFNNMSSVFLRQYVVTIYDSEGNELFGGQRSSEPGADNAGDNANHQNKLTDSLARHIVFNLASATAVTAESTSGIYLLPKDDSVMNIMSTSTGWIVSDGYVYNEGEWHFTYEDLKAVSKADLVFRKTINGVDAARDEIFEFKLAKFNGTGFVDVQTVDNDGDAIDFEVADLTEGWNVYEARESAVKNAEGSFATNTQRFYAVVQYLNMGSGASPVMVAGPPTYYTGFDASEFSASASTLSGLTGPVVNAEPTFSNTTDVGRLSIKKLLAPGTAADNARFTFVVHVNAPKNGSATETRPLTGIHNVTIVDANGDTVETRKVWFRDGVAAGDLAAGQTVTIESIPAGSTYSVEEEDADGYFLASKANDTGTIGKDATSASVFTNAAAGSLKVEKTVSSDVAADSNTQFAFTVTLDDDAVNGAFGSMTFTNGVAVFVLKDGESATATGLPQGVGYTVTEAHNDDFISTSSGESGSIEKGKTRTAKFTNTRGSSGKLTVSKTVQSNDASDKAKEFGFTVTLGKISGTFGDVTFTDNVSDTIAPRKGQTVRATGLPDRILYTVTASDSNLNGAYGDMEFTNGVCTYPSTDGTLKFAGNLPEDVTYVVTLAITGTYGGMEFANGVATFRLKDGESKSAEDLPLGVTYRVEESDSEGYAVHKTHDTGEVHPDTLVSFANEKVDASSTSIRLSGRKAITGKPAGMDLSGFKFTVREGDETVSTGTSDADGDIAFSPISYDQVGEHAYTVTEDADTKPGVANTAQPVTVKVSVADEGGRLVASRGNGGVELDAVNFTNTYSASAAQGEVRVKKNLTGRDWTDGDEFSFTLAAKTADAPMPATTQVKVNVSSANKTASFGAIEFKDAGTYEYTVTEEIGSAEGVTYDTAVHPVTFEVVDNGKGQLVAKQGNALVQTAEITNVFTSTVSNTTEIPVKKVWKDGANYDGIRPLSITVHLLADGTDTGKTATLGVDNSWEAKFTGLEKAGDGKDITYTVKEDVPDGYSCDISGDAAKGFVITNTHEWKSTGKGISIPVEKTWLDNGGEDAIEGRPSEVFVRLFANGKDTGLYVVLRASEGWTGKFENLPEETRSGASVEYTMKEGLVKYYAGDPRQDEEGVWTVENSVDETQIEEEEVPLSSNNDGSDLVIEDDTPTAATTGSKGGGDSDRDSDDSYSVGTGDDGNMGLLVMLALIAAAGGSAALTAMQLGRRRSGKAVK